MQTGPHELGLTGQFKTADARHLQVRNQEIDRPLDKNAQGLVTVGGRQHGMTGLLEDGDDDLAQFRFIVDQENSMQTVTACEPELNEFA